MNIWEKTFKKKKWGQYPPEDLIKFIKRTFKNKKNLKNIKILELGCGPGANVIFFSKEGFQIFGIDISPTAIKITKKKLDKKKRKNFFIGNFSNLPWKNNFFHGVVDNFSVYANDMKTIKLTYNEIHRVLKKKGFFFSKVWGLKTTGYGSGLKIEKNTFDRIKSGPCKNLGLSHFFSEKELSNLNSIFKINKIDRITYTDKFLSNQYFAEVLISQSFK